MSRVLICVCALLALCVLVTPDSVPVRLCPDAASSGCQLHEVRLEPRREYRGSYLLKRKNTASIAFDFTPEWAATRLGTGVYWVRGTDELPFPGFNGTGCDYTTCPTQPGVRQTYQYQLYLSKLINTGTFPIKWKVWNEENPSQNCCILLDIRIA